MVKSVYLETLQWFEWNIFVIFLTSFFTVDGYVEREKDGGEGTKNSQEKNTTIFGEEVIGW